MGFIKGNTNSFEVFLTDFGRQAFYRDGLKNESLFFSVSDDDSNYNIFNSPLYDPVNIINNPNNSIPVIELPSPSGSSRTVNNQHHVFTQTNKRGSVDINNTSTDIINGDGSILSRSNKASVLKTNNHTFNNYVAFEGDVDTTQDYSLISYRKTLKKYNGVFLKQFNVKGVNGLYLAALQQNTEDTSSQYDVDSLPQNLNDLNFSYINANYVIGTNANFYSGSNDSNKTTNVVPFSSITRLGYLIQNEEYTVDFDLQFSFFSLDFTTPSINVSINLMLGNNKVPVQFYSFDEVDPNHPEKNYVNDAQSSAPISTDLVEIISSNLLKIKNNISVDGVNSNVCKVKCRIPVSLCKKVKNLSIVVDYDSNGLAGGLAAPLCEFNIFNLKTTFIGVSVSNPNNYNTSITDKVYILNKNTTSVKFSSVVYKNAVLRNRNLSSSDKNLTISNSVTEMIDDNISIKNTFSFKGNNIGVLDVRFPYSYYIKDNVLILPFQSFPISGEYSVLSPGSSFQYYGQSLAEPNKKTGILDVNYNVNCIDQNGNPITEEITISVDLMNGGFVRPTDPGVCAYPQPAGTFVGYDQAQDCYKKPKIADGHCGFTYGDPVYDGSYCEAPPTTEAPTTEIQVNGQVSYNADYNSSGNKWYIEVNFSYVHVDDIRLDIPYYYVDQSGENGGGDAGQRTTITVTVPKHSSYSRTNESLGQPTCIIYNSQNNNGNVGNYYTQKVVVGNTTYNVVLLINGNGCPN